MKWIDTEGKTIWLAWLINIKGLVLFVGLFSLLPLIGAGIVMLGQCTYLWVKMNITGNDSISLKGAISPL